MDNNVKLTKQNGTYAYSIDGQTYAEKGVDRVDRALKGVNTSKEYGYYGYRGRIPLSHIKNIMIAINSDDVDDYYGHDLRYESVTPEQAKTYLDTKDSFGIGYLEYPEYEEYPE